MTSSLKQVDLRKELESHFGFDQFKSKQEEIIQSIIDGHDTFVIMPTGGGKSLCYQLPALIMEGTALVISPLIALMKNQVDSIRGYNESDDVAHFLNSSLNKTQIKQVKKDVKSEKTKLLYIAPETLVKEENLEFLKNINVSFVAVDEAHCISEWGHDFRPEYRNIRSMLSKLEQKIPLMALTATATPKVSQDIMKILEMDNVNQFITSFNRKNLYYEIRPKSSKAQTTKEIVQYIKSLGSPSGIIYVKNRKTTEELAEILNVNGIIAAPYHAGLDANTRSKTQDGFLMKDIDVIVATIAFGMGIDKPDVRFVIHFDMSKSIENYYQETGRAGRDGLLSYCLAFYSPKEMQNFEKFLRDKTVAERELGMMLLNEVMEYSESASCRREFLLTYFGENYNEKQCNELCDNCKYPVNQIEVEDELKELLQVVLDINENYPQQVVLDYVLGNNTQKQNTLKFDQHKKFGFGKDRDKIFWESLIRQAVLKGFMTKDIERYGVLELSDKGRKFVKSSSSFKIPVNRTFDDIEPDPVVSGGALDDDLRRMLGTLRDQVAKKNNLPGYVIFQDPSLDDMATKFPITMEDLLTVAGVNAGKAKKFGKPFVELIKNYVEENDIDRLTDMVVKTVANKSKSKVNIILGVDKQVPLDEIAESENITYDELLEEMYQIVNSGTKLDINYYLDAELDNEIIEEIIDYFMDAESDSLDDAFEELEEEDITMEEIKLVRLKFMSEQAN